MRSKKVESTKKETLVGKILRSAMTDLAEHNRAAYDILIRQANSGFLEQRQTRGTLDDLADTLLRTIKKVGGKEDAD